MLKVACEIYHRKRCYKKDLDVFFGVDTSQHIDDLFDWQLVCADYCQKTHRRILYTPHSATLIISQLYEHHWRDERETYPKDYISSSE